MRNASRIVAHDQGILHGRSPPKRSRAEDQFNVIVMKANGRMSPAEGSESIRTEAKRTVDTLRQRIFGERPLGSINNISLPVARYEVRNFEISVLLVYYMRTETDIQKVGGDMKAALEFQVQASSVPCSAIIFAIREFTVDRTF